MAQAKRFDALPSNAASTVKQFTLRVPDQDVQNMQTLLKLSPVAGMIYENSLPDASRRLGIRREWLMEAKRVWETDFDWKAVETHINSFPNFHVPIHDNLATFEIHFTALFSAKPDAIPVILLHGWPGSFLEFLPMLELFREKYTPETMPFHLIVPSLPGFTLSSMPLLDRDIDQVDVARIMNSLMGQIGFGGGYVAQGGDIGSRVARLMAVNHAECKAVHLNFCPMNRPASAKDDSTLSELERERLAYADFWKDTGYAYALEHATRPSTIGFVLSSNPSALLAWIGEKFLDWTDTPVPLQTILESCSLYWLTRCAHSSLWSYRHSFGPGPLIAQDDPKYYITIPFGYSYYPRESTAIPISWIATTGNLIWSKVHEKGGHFAALEQPEELMEDVENFIGDIDIQIA